MKNHTSVPMKILSLGEDGYHILCKVKINGKKYRALIDTGATKTVLSKTILNKLPKLEPVNLEEEKSHGIGDSPLEIDYYLLKNMRIGKRKIKPYVVGLMDVAHVDAMYLQLGHQPFDILLGGDVLKKYKLILDYGKKKLYIPRKK
jgi:hypothetical protein